MPPAAAGIPSCATQSLGRVVVVATIAERGPPGAVFFAVFIHEYLGQYWGSVTNNSNISINRYHNSYTYQPTPTQISL